jgi:hypothetical protein
MSCLCQKLNGDCLAIHPVACWSLHWKPILAYKELLGSFCYKSLMSFTVGNKMFDCECHWSTGAWHTKKCSKSQLGYQFCCIHLSVWNFNLLQWFVIKANRHYRLECLVCVLKTGTQPFSELLHMLIFCNLCLWYKHCPSRTLTAAWHLFSIRLKGSAWAYFWK